MPKLTLRFNGVTLREFELNGSRITVGRRSDNHIQLDDPAVSGTHAIFSLQPDPYMEGQFKVTLVDFNSTNGVFVNGERINQQPLHAGDVIRIGQHELLFDEPAASAFDQTAVLLQDDE
jgi:pSer/pThr/pTyr-binding forkhead associated (FHA) protein